MASLWLLLLATVPEVLSLEPAALGLPGRSIIVEARRLPDPARSNRAIVLWMIAPSQNPREDPEEPYTCPEESRGHSYTGPTRVSLVDLPQKHIINTIQIRDVHFPRKDLFDLPYRIHPGLYTVEQTDEYNEGTPRLLDFRDVNGDGKPYEFTFFDAVFCMGLETTLLGYNDRLDRLVQYPVDLDITLFGKRRKKTKIWVDYLFSKAPIRAGVWHFEIDYRGRGGCLDVYDIKYQSERERFNGTLDERDCAP
jgi:hypothetical protein